MPNLKVCIVKRNPTDFFYMAADGIKKCGDNARIFPVLAGDADLYAMWGVRRRDIVQRVARARRRLLVMERGYLGDRFHWTSFGYDGLNGQADFCNADVPEDRAEIWRPQMKPWRDGGEYALVIGQVPGDMSLGTINLGRWLTETLKHAQKRYSRVVYRPHPLAKYKSVLAEIPSSVEIHEGVSIEESLSGAICCLTYSSNSGVNAVMEGVPVMSQGACSMVRELSTHAVSETLKFPDRADWLRRMAYAQWTPDEIKDGLFWLHLRQGARKK